MANFQCRVYIQRINALPRGDMDAIPLNQWPSKSYIEIIIKGAIERRLPEYYVNMLKGIQHNDEEGGVRTEELLGRYARWPVCKCAWPGRNGRRELKLYLKK